MASTSTALTTKVESGSPYQLSQDQVLKASGSLLSHMKTPQKETSNPGGKKNLLADTDDDASPIWLVLATKKHIADTKRLKPTKVAVPHSLNSSESTTICLITADPQRKYKDIVASPQFPSALGSRITKVVGIDKIKRKYTQYEAQRKLKAEHDIFLADDRIIVGLPKLLGKTLFKGTSKRPIPVSLAAPAPRTEGKRMKREKGEAPDAAGPLAIAKEIEKALAGIPLYLSPSTSTAIKVGYSNWSAQKLAENIDAAAVAVIEKHVPQKWRNVKAMHIKGDSTTALPIWLADELWVDETDVLTEAQANEVAQANMGKKRKAVEGVVEEKQKTQESIPAKKQKLLESNDDSLDKEIALRKDKLNKQKLEAAQDVVDEVPRPSKKSKKAKGKKDIAT